MIDPKEAVVELEVIGYRFHLKDGDIDYTYKRSTYPLEEYVREMFLSIKNHKDEIYEWLSNRSFCEIAWILSSIRDRTRHELDKKRKDFGEYSQMALSWESYDWIVYEAYLDVLQLAKAEQQNNPKEVCLSLPTKHLPKLKFRLGTNGIYEASCED